MELQTAFYIIGIIFMSLMLLIMIGIVVAVFVIKHKIDSIHRQIEERLSVVTNLKNFGSDLVDAAKQAVSKK